MNRQDQKVTLPNGQEALPFALLALKGAMKLELVGMKRHGESAYAQIKRLLGIKGDKQKVYDQYIAWLQEKELLPK